MKLYQLPFSPACQKVGRTSAGFYRLGPDGAAVSYGSALVHRGSR